MYFQKFYDDFRVNNRLSESNYLECKQKTISLDFTESPNDFVVTSLLIQNVPKTDFTLKRLGFVSKKYLQDVWQTCDKIFGETYNVEKTNSGIIMSALPNIQSNELKNVWGKLCYFYQSLLIDRTLTLFDFVDNNPDVKCSGQHVKFSSNCPTLTKCGFKFNSLADHWKVHKYIQSPVKSLFLETVKKNNGTRLSQTKTQTVHETRRGSGTLRLKSSKVNEIEPETFDVFSKMIESMRVAAVNETTTQEDELLKNKLYGVLQAENSMRNNLVSLFVEKLHEKGKSKQEIEEILSLLLTPEIQVMEALDNQKLEDIGDIQIEQEMAFKLLYEKVKGSEYKSVPFKPEIIELSVKGNLRYLKTLMLGSIENITSPTFEEDLLKDPKYKYMKEHGDDFLKDMKNRFQVIDYIHKLLDTELDMMETMAKYSSTGLKNMTAYINAINYNRQFKKSFADAFILIMDEVIQKINGYPKRDKKIFFSMRNNEQEEKQKEENLNESTTAKIFYLVFALISAFSIALCFFTTSASFYNTGSRDISGLTLVNEPVTFWTNPISIQKQMEEMDQARQQFAGTKMEDLPKLRGMLNKNYGESLRKKVNINELETKLMELTTDIKEDYLKPPIFEERVIPSDISSSEIVDLFKDSLNDVHETYDSFNGTSNVFFTSNGNININPDTMIVKSHNVDARNMFNKWADSEIGSNPNASLTDRMFTFLSNNPAEAVKMNQNILTGLIGDLITIIDEIPSGIAGVVGPVALELQRLVDTEVFNVSFENKFKGSAKIIGDVLSENAQNLEWDVKQAIGRMQKTLELFGSSPKAAKVIDTFARNFVDTKYEENIVKKLIDGKFEQEESQAMSTVLKSFVPGELTTTDNRIANTLGSYMMGLTRWVSQETRMQMGTSTSATETEAQRDSRRVAASRSVVRGLRENFNDNWEKWATDNTPYGNLPPSEQLHARNFAQDIIVLINYNANYRNIEIAETHLNSIAADFVRFKREQRKTLFGKARESLTSLKKKLENGYAAFFAKTSGNSLDRWQVMKKICTRIGDTMKDLIIARNRVAEHSTMLYIATNATSYLNDNPYYPPNFEQDPSSLLPGSIGHFKYLWGETTDFFQDTYSSIINGIIMAKDFAFDEIFNYTKSWNLIYDTIKTFYGQPTHTLNLAYYYLMHNLISGTIGGVLSAIEMLYDDSVYFSTSMKGHLANLTTRTDALKNVNRNPTWILLANTLSFFVSIPGLRTLSNVGWTVNREIRYFINFNIVSAITLNVIYKLLTPVKFLSSGVRVPQGISWFLSSESDAPPVNEDSLAWEWGTTFVIPAISLVGLTIWKVYSTLSIAEKKKSVKTLPTHLALFDFMRQGVRIFAPVVSFALNPLRIFYDQRAVYYRLVCILSHGPWLSTNEEGRHVSPWYWLKKDPNIRKDVIREVLFTPVLIKNWQQLWDAWRRFISFCTLLQNDQFYVFIMDKLLSVYAVAKGSDEGTERRDVEDILEREFRDLKDPGLFDTPSWINYLISNFRSNYSQAEFGFWGIDKDPLDTESKQYRDYKLRSDRPWDYIWKYKDLQPDSDLHVPSPAKKDILIKFAFQRLIARCTSDFKKATLCALHASFNSILRGFFEEVIVNSILSQVQLKFIEGLSLQTTSSMKMREGINKYLESQKINKINNDPGQIVGDSLLYNAKKEIIGSTRADILGLFTKEDGADKFSVKFVNLEDKNIPGAFRAGITDQTLSEDIHFYRMDNITSSKPVLGHLGNLEKIMKAMRILPDAFSELLTLLNEAEDIQFEKDWNDALNGST
jgi:hypothetical protein